MRTHWRFMYPTSSYIHYDDTQAIHKVEAASKEKLAQAAAELEDSQGTVRALEERIAKVNETGGKLTFRCLSLGNLN